MTLTATRRRAFACRASYTAPMPRGRGAGGSRSACRGSRRSRPGSPRRRPRGGRVTGTAPLQTPLQQLALIRCRRTPGRPRQHRFAMQVMATVQQSERPWHGSPAVAHPQIPVWHVPEQHGVARRRRNPVRRLAGPARAGADARVGGAGVGGRRADGADAQSGSCTSPRAGRAAGDLRIAARRPRAHGRVAHGRRSAGEASAPPGSVAPTRPRRRRARGAERLEPVDAADVVAGAREPWGR